MMSVASTQKGTSISTASWWVGKFAQICPNPPSNLCKIAGEICPRISGSELISGTLEATLRIDWLLIVTHATPSSHFQVKIWPLFFGAVKCDDELAVVVVVTLENTKFQLY